MTKPSDEVKRNRKRLGEYDATIGIWERRADHATKNLQAAKNAKKRFAEKLNQPELPF